jgi:hypothetical protein
MILSKSPLLRHIGGDTVRVRVLLEKTNNGNFCVRRQYVDKNDAGKFIVNNGNGTYREDERSAHIIFTADYKQLVDMGYLCDFSAFREEFYASRGGKDE